MSGKEMTERQLGWFDIARLGLVQAALGSIIVLTTSTLNRVMVVELGLAASIPGALVGLHYGVQISRPLWGHRSDSGRGRTRWILAGMAALGIGGVAASATPMVFAIGFLPGILAAILAYALIGLGVGACGTSLLALMASRTAPQRRAAAATIVWMMMIAGIIVTAIVTGSLLDPYTPARLVAITAAVSGIAFALTLAAIAGIERAGAQVARRERPPSSVRNSLSQVWSSPADRLFTIFVFVSMLAYSAQDLILEPFGGLLFAMTPGETTSLSGVQHMGVFAGMLLVGVAGGLFARRKGSVLRAFTIAGCAASACALALLATASIAAPQWPLAANIALLGFANGAFAVAAIGTMMELAGEGGGGREGIRMGVWGAAQAIAFGLGGFSGTVALDAARFATGSESLAFASVFLAEAGLFVLAALIATRTGPARRPAMPPFGGLAGETAE